MSGMGVNLSRSSLMDLGPSFPMFPELVPKDPPVRLKCPRKQAGRMDLLPNISASSPTALGASSSEVLGATPVSHLQPLGEGSWYHMGSWTLSAPREQWQS